MQLDLALLPREALLGQPGRLAHRGREVLVAAAPGPAAGQRHLLSGAHEVVLAPVPARDLRARRDQHDERLAVRAVLQSARPVPASVRAVVAAAPERLQVAQRVVAADDHVAAAAAVAAVGPALRDVGLTPEGQRSIAAPPGSNLDTRAIGQHAPG